MFIKPINFVLFSDCKYCELSADGKWEIFDGVWWKVSRIEIEIAGDDERANKRVHVYVSFPELCSLGVIVARMIFYRLCFFWR